MENKVNTEQEEIFSKVVRAGRRTYFFDVRATKAGDYYLTLTESKKFTNPDGSFHYKKHKIYLYKEDFESFKETLDEMMSFILTKKEKKSFLKDTVQIIKRNLISITKQMMLRLKTQRMTVLRSPISVSKTFNR